MPALQEIAILYYGRAADTFSCLVGGCGLLEKSTLLPIVVDGSDKRVVLFNSEAGKLRALMPQLNMFNKLIEYPFGEARLARLCR